MKKISLCLMSLILVFTQVVVVSSDVSSYDLMADVNRDRIVDVNDLARVGQAYGSSLVLPSEPGKTVVTVVSFDKEPPEVENARVAVVDPSDLDNQRDNPINVTYTNSSGIATFELGNNKNYTTIAWSGSAYNFANFTTSSLGEASVMILLGESSLPPTHELPKGWIVITLLDNETGFVYHELFRITFDGLEYDTSEGWQSNPPEIWVCTTNIGVIVVPPDRIVNEPHSARGGHIINVYGDFLGSCTFSPDENGCANVVLYVPPP